MFSIAPCFHDQSVLVYPAQEKVNAIVDSFEIQPSHKVTDEANNDRRVIKTA